MMTKLISSVVLLIALASTMVGATTVHAATVKWQLQGTISQVSEFLDFPAPNTFLFNGDQSTLTLFLDSSTRTDTNDGDASYLSSVLKKPTLVVGQFSGLSVGGFSTDVIKPDSGRTQTATNGNFDFNDNNPPSEFTSTSIMLDSQILLDLALAGVVDPLSIEERIITSADPIDATGEVHIGPISSAYTFRLNPTSFSTTTTPIPLPGAIAYVPIIILFLVC